MGIFDHRKTWRFTTRASDDECFEAFRSAFITKRNPLLVGGRWTVDRTPAGATATYGGRAGLASYTTQVAWGTTGNQTRFEADAAIGSKVRFELDEDSDPLQYMKTWSMWLGSSTKVGFGLVPTVFVADARFIRPHLRQVETNLRAIDPRLTTTRV